MAYYRHCYSIFTAVGLNFILSGSLHVFAGNVLLIITTHKSKISVGFLLNPPLTLILCLPPSWSDCQRAQSRTEKMFLIVVSQGPPVGSYEIKSQRHGTAPGFGKGKRFAELKGWSGN